MATNLAIDEQLLEQALRVGGHRTKRATVNEALEEYIKRRKRLRATEAFGTIDFDPKFSYKRARRRR
ncbi:MAG: antitoxin [Candidatus Rokubacteria bacterium RIFCSPLOWO2_02_FULL_71_18]|nr:MAG: antitoxin [Candidatus Rokubacteria bacterium RIFCSPLOWO2_02_FULL_71_18]